MKLERGNFKTECPFCETEKEFEVLEGKKEILICDECENEIEFIEGVSHETRKYQA